MKIYSTRRKMRWLQVIMISRKTKKKNKLKMLRETRTQRTMKR